MDDKYKTKEQLINELKKTRQRIAGIEASETKRKDIEEKLQESEEKYRKQFEETLDAIFIADAGKGIIIDCNRAASKLVEREKSELIGKHQRILHPPGEFKGEFSKTFKQHIKEKEGQILEAQVITKKGEIKNVAIKANSFEIKGKKLLQGIFRDITERKKSEDAMRESERKYRDLYDNAPDMYHSLDKDGIIIDCNETEAKMLGYKKEEIIGRPVTDFFTEESGRLFKKDFPRLNEENKLINIEREFVRKDGTVLPAMLNVFTEYDKNGEFVKTRTISRDITALIQAENALRDSEKKYRNLVDNALVGIYKTNLKGDILYANKALVEMLEFDSLEEMMSVNVLTTYKNPDDREELIKNLMRKNKINNLEIELITKTGKSKNIILNATLEKDIVSGMMMDISERKKAEQALLESEKELRIKTSNLGEANVALKVLLKRRDEDKVELEEKILLNVKELVIPYLEKLKKCRIDEQQMAYLSILESNLNDIVLPFSHKLSSKFLNFTPTEIQVANLLRQGKTNKEISKLLNSSFRTVAFHRENIRKKLGLTNKKINLKSYLMSLV